MPENTATSFDLSAYLNCKTIDTPTLNFFSENINSFKNEHLLENLLENFSH